MFPLLSVIYLFFILSLIHFSLTICFVSFHFVLSFFYIAVYGGSWSMYVGSVVAQHNGIALYYWCLPGITYIAACIVAL